MLQPAQIGFEEAADVGHAVFQHRHAIQAEAEGKALIPARIDAAILQHFAMDHAAAAQLQPIIAGAEGDLAGHAAVAAHVPFQRRFGEGKEAGAGAQLDLVQSDPAAFRALAKEKKWKVKGPKRTFLIDGDDRVGACADVLGRLAAAKINVTAMDAVASSAGRYTAILWVKARDVKKAAAVLGAV